MKTILWMAILCTLTAMSAPGQTPSLQKAKKLAEAGNDREAAETAKALLKPGGDFSSQDRAEALELAVESLITLSAEDEAETVIENAARNFPKDWRILVAAAAGLGELDSEGVVIDGKFIRGDSTERGRSVYVAARDHARQFQLFDQALRAQPADAAPEDRKALLGAFGYWFEASDAGPEAVWSLLSLTDLKDLPDYDDETGLDDPASGYPVDADGNPAFFNIPATWDAAANDGERLRWIMAEWSKIDAESRYEAAQAQIELASSWFSVATMAGSVFRPLDDNNEGERRSGISALHTLKDDETVARLATGPKRFALPPDWAFLDLARTLAEDADAPKEVRRDAWETIAKELTNRRHFSRAAEAHDKALALTESAEEKKSIEAAIKQIRGNLGNFETQPSQPAGREAKLQLVFRNAQKFSLTARRVDVAKLLADTEAYLRSSPQEMDWQETHLQAIGHRLIKEGNNKYLGEVVASWEQELKPRAGHWDRRVEVPTPLKAAGAWWIEGTFEGGHVARALLWIEDIVIVQTHQEGRGHYFVADALTGAPVSGATVKFFGWRQEWKDSRLPQQRPRYVFSFRDHQAVTDAQGQASLPRIKADEYQWLVTAVTPNGRRAFMGFEHLWFGGRREGSREETRLYTITDRPVYRPDQEVKWQAWARTVGYGMNLNTNRFKGASIQVLIHDPRGEKILDKSYKADDFGAFGDSLLLGPEATLGSYTMTMAWKRPLLRDEHLGNHQFRVEEYKKPEFEVKVEAPTIPVALGDSFEAKVKADYYFGGPVKEGKVKYKVQRTVHNQHWFPPGPWDWLFGAGYNWRGTFYDWYPGSQRWSRCMPPLPWWPRRSDPPELVAEGESPLNADGTFTIKVDTDLAKELHGDDDHRFEIEAQVTDQSRRMIVGSGVVLAARRPFEVYVWPDRGYYQAGEGGEIRIAARTLDGKPVTAKGKLRLLRVTYDANGKPKEEEVSSFDIKTGEEEVKQPVKWTRGGQYRLSCQLTDEGRHEIEGSTFVTVRGEGFQDGSDFRFDALELITQRDGYLPGEEVEITLNTNRPGSTVALFLRAQNGVYPPPVWIKLEGKSTTHRFTLKEEDQPNIFIDAYTVSDARVHQVTRQIIVPPKKRIATVELETDKATYLPRENPQVKLRVKDQDGKPFVGRVVLTAYDKALEYISGGSNVEDIRPFFWGWKRSHNPRHRDSLRMMEVGVQRPGEISMASLGAFGGYDDSSDDRALGRSRGLVKSGAPMALAAAPPPQAAFADAALGSAAPAQIAAVMPPEEAGGPEGQSSQPMIRSNLADSAVWIADLTTDANGEGTLNFTMPDNLTTWKLRSWVLGPQTQVGEATVEVITRKNLMVRLQAPRFFVEKDEVVISANVHNEMDDSQDIKAVLELEGGVLELMEGSKATASASLKGHSEKRFDWRIRVTGEGEAEVRVKALAQKDSDAIEMTFPAYTHGMLKTDSWSLALRPDQTTGSLKFRVPAERKPDQSRLEVRYSPTLAMALVDALPYLVDYPYGCTEQTLNRFVPTVITLGVLKDLGVNLADIRKNRTNLNAQQIGDPKKRAEQANISREAVFDDAEVRRMGKAGIDRLTAMRNGDGGWGWFPGGRESSPHITALVLHGLHAAERRGLDVNDGIIRGAVEWLKAHEAKQLQYLRLPEKDKNHKDSPDNLDALIHSVLVENDAGDSAMRTFLYDKRNNLSRYSVALLGLTCHALKETERREMCLRNLQQFLKQDDENQTAWLDLPQNSWWWMWYDDQIETQAAYLRLLVAAQPKGELVPRLVKYLLNNRRNGACWNSTKDTAAVIEALAAFIKASGEDKPNIKIEIAIDGEVKKTVEITPANLFTFDGTLLLEGDDLKTGEHTLEFRKTGASPLYSNAYLTVFSQEDMIPAAGLEVKVRRKFYKLIEEKPDQKVAGSRGQVVTQTGFKYRREEIPSDAEIKSGDLIEVELSVESKNDYEYIIIEDLKPAGFEPIEVQSGWTWEALPAYKEYRDEKVAFFAERLPRGTHNLSYRVKAEIPGRFSALPTKVEAMYAPEIKGNSTEWKARITE